MNTTAPPSNPFETGWTGGQYSLFRALLGLWMLFLFGRFLPLGASLAGKSPPEEVLENPIVRSFPNLFAVSSSSAVATGLIVVGMLLAVLLIVGYFDRWAAIGLWYLWACVYTLSPETAGKALPWMGWLLLAHACVPPAPFGSLAARGRVDPRGGWRMSLPAYLSAWVLLAAGYAIAGSIGLIDAWRFEPQNRLHTAFALSQRLPAGLIYLMLWIPALFGVLFSPLVMLPNLRPWIWLVGLVGQFTGLCLGIDPELRLGMMLLHLFVFDPAWVPALGPAAPEMLFYDGHCGLCHRFVRVVLSEDRTGAFRLAPLDSDAFRAAATEEQRAALPDSTVVKTADGQLLTQSAGVLHVLARMGGLWRVFASLGGLVPRGWADRVYAGIAGVRRRLFAAPAAACPILPPDLRARFEH